MAGLTAMGDTMKRSTPFISDGMPEILESSNVKDDSASILDTTEYVREREERVMVLRSIFFERCFL